MVDAERWFEEEAKREAELIAGIQEATRQVAERIKNRAPYRRPGVSAEIDPHLVCEACGWPAVTAMCNDGMASTEPYCGSDRWVYCSNKTCKNHAGEDVSMGMPETYYWRDAD